MLKCNIFVCQFKERLKTQKGEFTFIDKEKKGSERERKIT